MKYTPIVNILMGKIERRCKIKKPLLAHRHPHVHHKKKASFQLLSRVLKLLFKNSAMLSHRPNFLRIREFANFLIFLHERVKRRGFRGQRKMWTTSRISYSRVLRLLSAINTFSSSPHHSLPTKIIRREHLSLLLQVC